jgi:hypothetical protein
MKLGLDMDPRDFGVLRPQGSDFLLKRSGAQAPMADVLAVSAPVSSVGMGLEKTSRHMAFLSGLTDRVGPRPMNLDLTVQL